MELDKLEYDGDNIMDNKKKVSLAVVIINCLCAVLWNVTLFLDLVNGYTDSVAFMLHIVCAIVWDACAVIWIIRYKKSQKQNE